jgi:hypothetical protein
MDELGYLIVAALWYSRQHHNTLAPRNKYLLKIAQTDLLPVFAPTQITHTMGRLDGKVAIVTGTPPL